VEGKDGHCVRLTTLPPLCADCFEIWEPQPPGTLRVCPGLNVVATFTLYISESDCVSLFRLGSSLDITGVPGYVLPCLNTEAKRILKRRAQTKKSDDRQIPKKKIVSVKCIFSYTHKTIYWERSETNYNQRRDI
jgi:hypothetical protein